MKRLIILAALTLSSLAFAANEDDEITTSDMEAFCAVPCAQRSSLGRCLRYGPDFCTPFAGTACVLRCVQRSISERCLSFGSDYCGIYPSCVANCIQRSISGRCLNYGSDLCVSW